MNFRLVLAFKIILNSTVFYLRFKRRRTPLIGSEPSKIEILRPYRIGPRKSRSGPRPQKNWKSQTNSERSVSSLAVDESLDQQFINNLFYGYFLFVKRLRPQVVKVYFWKRQLTALIEKSDPDYRPKNMTPSHLLILGFILTVCHFFLISFWVERKVRNFIFLLTRRGRIKLITR